VVFAIDSSSTGAGRINGNNLTVTAAGTFVLVANHLDNTNYSAAPQVQQTLVLHRRARLCPDTDPAARPAPRHRRPGDPRGR
jgi:hypothetical protein